ncbi:acyl transferase [Dyadobacter psychrotolerans]|uniref:Acyl transferase n=1 Tax=Dyadobacter psychrotolerans TaxID=2541721 RepID=A0A4R5DZU7_9BACT|nr:acyl transferase [Dyadobacter psychrotolerans]TDE18244.1 acyl transferase [Dyadobacter psychrotolerans]
MELPSNKSSVQLRSALRQQITDLKAPDFENLALQIFRYQATHNPIYHQYLTNLKTDVTRVEQLTEIPFLPIQFFKHHLIQTGQPPAPAATFESSGTTAKQTPERTATATMAPVTSRHTLFDAPLYNSVSTSIFQQHYGDLTNYHILALLPSYLERNNSSLVYMMNNFIDQTASELSGFYLNNTGEMLDRLRYLSQNPDGKTVLLMGVTFALLDLAESDLDFSFLKNIKNLIIMDTGGMKGRRQELLREEVHDILTSGFGVPSIHSEYGMTELLSQGYSNGEGLFNPGYTMRILLRDINDPFSLHDHNLSVSKTGGINAIDLANLDTCSFIETQDLGRFGTEPGTFYVMGRFDNSDIRGCNLMVL